MFDEALRLAESPALLDLLRYYATLPTVSRDDWHDRRMDVPGLTSAAMVRLHGELLAYGWLEQNTGQTPQPRTGAVVSCYRVTSAGRKQLAESADNAEA